ncbi:stage II sporulation protein M [Halostella salina]|uniref:stage II sporulation protein M n=1 Tax=Halostella salina TaxID=1547897 RepID=UPI0013CEA444|nr:stage II sporulation protein M [Halostella salina]
MDLQWLALAAREHRRYLLFSLGVFLVGTLGGVGLVVQDVDLLAELGFSEIRGVIPGELTVLSLLANNTRAFAIMLLGALTLGLLTAFGLVVNGVLVGYVGAIAGGQQGLGFVLLAIAPHGVLELPALFVASAVAFRVVARTALRVAGRRDSVQTRAEWRRTLGFVAAAWIALAVAAVIEIHVTFPLVEALYG